jgi:hypothetical protein
VFVGALHLQAGVASVWVVEGLDVAEELESGLVAGLEGASLDEFVLDRRDAALRGGSCEVGPDGGAANPINPRGVPRGIAKKDVYRELGRLDQEGPDPLERAFLRDRHRRPEQFDDPEPRLFSAGVPPATGIRLSAKDAVALLLWRAALLRYTAADPTVDEVARAVEKISNDDQARGQRVWDGYWAEKEQEEEDLAFELLLMKRQSSGLSEEEESYFEDLRFLRGVFQTLRGVPLRRSRGIAEQRFGERFGRPLNPIPPSLAKELRAVQAKRQRRQRKEAASFQRQLGNLPLLSPAKQGQRLGEYRRAMKTQRAKRRSTPNEEG